jgi:transcriptional regulator with XRE-family HTH domain
MTQHRCVSGPAIKAIREALGLSLRDLETRIQQAGETMDHAQLQRFEKSQRTPSDIQARAIADALGVPLSAISFATRVVIVAAVPDQDAA